LLIILVLVTMVVVNIDMLWVLLIAEVIYSSIRPV